MNGVEICAFFYFKSISEKIEYIENIILTCLLTCVPCIAGPKASPSAVTQEELK
jgi:hypothetical protein